MDVPSDPSRRTLDRATLARRRAGQLATLLAQAESAAETGDVDAAIAACEEVLVLDPENEAATRLFERIKAESDPARVDDTLCMDPVDASSQAASEFLAELARPKAPAPGGETPAVTISEPVDQPYTPSFLSPAIPEPSVALDLFSSETDLALVSGPAVAVPRPPLELRTPLDELRLSTPPVPAAGAAVSPPRATLPGAPVRPRAHFAFPPAAMRQASNAPSVVARWLRGVTLPAGWSTKGIVGAAMLVALSVFGVWAGSRLPRADVTAGGPAPKVGGTTSQPLPGVTTAGPATPSPPHEPSPTGVNTESRTAGPALAPRTPSASPPALEEPRATATRGVDVTGSRAPAVATSGARESVDQTRRSALASPAPFPAAAREAPATASTVVASPAAVPEAASARPAAPAPGPAPAPVSPQVTLAAEAPPVLPRPASPIPTPTAPAASPTVSSATGPPPPIDRAEDRDRTGARSASGAAPVTTAASTSSASAAPAVPTSIDEERAVQEAVRAYTSAYSGLDADGVKAVFPAVNDAALRRAFRSLRSQQVDLRGMTVSVSGDAALVSGTWVSAAVGQVGGSTPQRDERPVVFTLAKRGGVWVIVSRR